MEDEIIASTIKKDQEIVSDNNKKQDDITPLTTREVQTIVSSVCEYY